MAKPRHYERMAPLYDLTDVAEPLYKKRIRHRLFAGLGGRILDAGVGTGRNMPYYPASAGVVGTDVSLAMLKQAKAQRWRLGRNVELVATDIVNTGFADGSFDAVVASFLFSSLGETLQVPALTELARISAPDGEVRLLDYTLSKQPMLRLFMRLFWSPWQMLLFGCSFERQTEKHLRAAGLELVREDYLVLDVVRLIVARPGRT